MTMSDYRYLKDESWYSERYDLHTIETCLEYYWGLKGGFEKHRNDDDFKKFTNKQFDEDVHKVASYTVNAIKIERFRRRRESIEKWMREDKVKQDRLDNAAEPQGIFCSHCTTLMHWTMKNLEDFTNEPLRVLFFFECPNCKKRKGVYDDGTERVSKPQLCPQCKEEVKVGFKKKGNVLTWTTKCASCGYKEADKDDGTKWETEQKKREEREKMLLEKYRDEFCYSEKVGQQAVWDADQLKVLVDEWRERDKHKAEYDAVANIKKLTVVELEKLLNDTIAPKNYTRLMLSQPEFGKQLIVSFNVQDGETGRKEYDSQHTLKKLIKSALEQTNWRLFSEGVTYRLGYLQGRLKGYEAEDDLLALVRHSKK